MSHNGQQFYVSTATEFGQAAVGSAGAGTSQYQCEITAIIDLGFLSPVGVLIELTPMNGTTDGSVRAK